MRWSVRIGTFVLRLAMLAVLLVVVNGLEWHVELELNKNRDWVVLVDDSASMATKDVAAAVARRTSSRTKRRWPIWRSSATAVEGKVNLTSNVQRHGCWTRANRAKVRRSFAMPSCVPPSRDNARSTGDAHRRPRQRAPPPRPLGRRAPGPRYSRSTSGSTARNRARSMRASRPNRYGASFASAKMSSSAA